LAVADKPDSHEICFVPDRDAGGFVERALPEGARDGEMVDTTGRVLGRHGGVHRFTVGQRKGLGLSSAIPLYVLKVDAATARVTVGPRDSLGQNEMTASGINWVSGETPAEPLRVTARIRHRHQDAPATVTPLPHERAHVRFDEPQIAITPGQAAVFYQGDDVLGGGWID
jgi:tRNA-specific 2-thiouridylase